MKWSIKNSAKKANTLAKLNEISWDDVYYLNTMHRNDKEGIEISDNVPVDKENCVLKPKDEKHQGIAEDKATNNLETRKEFHLRMNLHPDKRPC